MVNLKYKIFLPFLSLLMLVSCNDWLELLPPQGLIKEEYWKKKEDVEAVLVGAYSTLSKMDGNLFKYGEIRADMLSGNSNQPWGDRQISQGNIYPDNSLCDWTNFYKVISAANSVIKNAPSVKGEDNTFTDYQMYAMISEAVFLRSLSYFYLVRIFKDVPYTTEPAEDDDAEMFLNKTDGDKILETILADLEQNFNAAPNEVKQTTSSGFGAGKGRATKAAYSALMADICLWRYDYAGCLSHIQKLETSSPQFILIPGNKWFNLFYPTRTSGSELEIIFELEYATTLQQNNSMYGITSEISNQYLASETAVDLFKKDAKIPQTVRGTDASIRKLNETQYTVWKYVGRAADGTSVRTTNEINDASFIVYRYADILLMKAEALSQLERYEEARQEINKVRARAMMSPIVIADSKIAFEDAIMNERAAELAYEGKRWFDLLRMGRRSNYSRKAEFLKIIVKNIVGPQRRVLATKLNNPLGWYLPIYKDELERNINLVQNPYYKN